MENIVVLASARTPIYKISEKSILFFNCILCDNILFFFMTFKLLKFPSAQTLMVYTSELSLYV